MDLNDTQRQDLADSYEGLRRGWLNQGSGQMRGLAFFLRRGMSAWIRVWLECVPGRKDRVESRGDNLPDGAKNISLPSGLYADTVHVLAEMAMNKLKEIGI